jgi:hypothetical protein
MRFKTAAERIHWVRSTPGVAWRNIHYSPLPTSGSIKAHDGVLSYLLDIPADAALPNKLFQLSFTASGYPSNSECKHCLFSAH